MEAAPFSHSIFRHLKPYAAELQMGHPARMKAISAGKKKTTFLGIREWGLNSFDLFRACSAQGW